MVHVNGPHSVACTNLLIMLSLSSSMQYLPSQVLN